jgi:PEGA domain
MTNRKTITATVIGAALLALTVVPAASAAGVRFVVRPYYGFGPHYAYGWYGPRWYYPYYPGYYPGVYVPAAPPTGDVKIDTHMKGGSIYVDGGFAGETSKLKKFSLRPGNHDIEVRDAAGYTMYKERVQVLAGKTTDIKLPA